MIYKFDRLVWFVEGSEMGKFDFEDLDWSMKDGANTVNMKLGGFNLCKRFESSFVFMSFEGFWTFL